VSLIIIKYNYKKNEKSESEFVREKVNLNKYLCSFLFLVHLINMKHLHTF
jgi:hypothetical protein